MGNKNKMKRLINKIEKAKWIFTQGGWNNLLRMNNLPVSPAFLKEEIESFIKKPENKPKGNSLLCLRKNLDFTMVKEDEEIKPGRSEEALERFIVISNDEVFNQIPVGGRKENIDLGYWENNDKEIFNFVELKAWEGDESPFYAVIEGLKNLSLFKMVKTKKRSHKEKKKYALDSDEVKKIKLIMLAPSEYFDEYFIKRFKSDSREKKKSKFRKFLSFVNDIEKEFNKGEKKFNMQISFRALEIKQEDFYERCRKRIDENNWKDWKSSKGTKKGDRQKIKIGKEDKIDNLERGKWKKIEKWEDLK